MNNKEQVVILSAVRTPIGSFSGGLSTLKAHELGSIVIKESLKRASVQPTDVSEVILGQVLTAGQGQNPARQASVNAGLPHEVPATLIGMVCGSGLRSVTLGSQAIALGDSKVVIAGGQESMSQAQHTLFMRNGVKFGDVSLNDTMIIDGLQDAFQKYHMGITAENVAKKWNITREEQDQFSYGSQIKTAEAQKQGYFTSEIVPVEISGRKGNTIVDKDEFPRNETTFEGLSKLKPAFVRDGSGSVTAGNSSGLNDGAAVVVLASESYAKEKDLKPLAKVISYANAGVDPSIMGIGPVPAVKKALEKANWSIEEVDLFELNEAFAAQSVAVSKELKIDSKKINIWGGAISIGHPIGASGTRILVTLIHALKATGGKKGVAALCIGGGMGIAICIEMV